MDCIDLHLCHVQYLHTDTHLHMYETTAGWLKTGRHNHKNTHLPFTRRADLSVLVLEPSRDEFAPHPEVSCSQEPPGTAPPSGRGRYDKRPEEENNSETKSLENSALVESSDRLAGHCLRSKVSPLTKQQEVMTFQAERESEICCDPGPLWIYSRRWILVQDSGS